MEIFVFWFLFSLLAAYVAGNKGRSAFGFFLLSLILSPLIGLIFAVLCSDLNYKQRVTPDTHERCPDCAELILKEAMVCKHCGKKFNSTVYID